MRNTHLYNNLFLSSNLLGLVDEVEVAFAMDPAEFKAKYGVTKPPLDTPELVFHCQMGRRGAVATDKAQKLGYTQ